MKELILITSHASDIKKEQMLRDLVNDFNGKNYDIMISTHIFIPKDIFEKSNYVICDAENKILTDINQKSVMVFGDHDFIVSSTETFRGNHGFAMIKLLLNGLSYAKNLGYDKVHFFEYDSKINSLVELEENSKLLDTYNIIYYTTSLFTLPSAPMSLSIKKISEEWFNLSNEKILEFFNGNTSKLSEEYEKILIDKSHPVLCKDKELLKQLDITVGLHDEIQLNRWMVPVYNEKSKQMFFFGWNIDSNKTVEVNILVNKKKIVSLEIHSGTWNFIDLGLFSEIQNLTFIINNKTVNYWDFDDIGREKFISRNHIKYKIAE